MANNRTLDRPLRILLETSDGRSASALLENGFLQHCIDRGAEVHVLSPGACFDPFIERYRLPGTQFTYLSLEQVNKARYPHLVAYEQNLGNWLSRHGFSRARRALWQVLGERLTAADAAFLNQFVNQMKPDCFLTSQLNQGCGRGLVAMCHRKGIPTLGNVYSWDHPFHPQRSRPDHLTCWSEEVRNGLIRMGDFLPEQIEVIGAPAFDPYFDPKGVCTRKELCDQLGLDPARPILLFATLGQSGIVWDETGTFRAFLAALKQAKLPGPPQIILRLHPLSRDHYFQEFRAHKDVVFSRYLRYCPGMHWWPSREEYILAGNILRHADVCISPGSTMTIEPAIFDTPTVVPTFNPTMSEEYERRFRKGWLDKHLRFLVQADAVALARSPDELIASIRHALSDPTRLSEGRKKIREQLLGPLDGKSTERLARATVACAESKLNTSQKKEPTCTPSRTAA